MIIGQKRKKCLCVLLFILFPYPYAKGRAFCVLIIVEAFLVDSIEIDTDIDVIGKISTEAGFESRILLT